MNMEIQDVVSNVTKPNVEAVVRDCIKEHGISQAGNEKFNATECYGLCLTTAHEEMCETVGAESAAERRTVFMFVWQHYPKNPSAWRQHFFGEKKEGVSAAQSLADKYSF